MKKIRTCATAIAVPTTGCTPVDGMNVTFNITIGSNADGTHIGFSDGTADYLDAEVYGSIDVVEGTPPVLFYEEISYDGTQYEFITRADLGGNLINSIYVNGEAVDVLHTTQMWTADDIGKTFCISADIRTVS